MKGCPVLPQIREIMVDRLSLPNIGCVEVAGRVIWSDSNATGEVTTLLRLVERDTNESHQSEPSHVTAASGQVVFRFELDLRTLERSTGGETFDAYLVLKSRDDESVTRLAWPRAFSSWSAYPTVYGNLSLKRTNTNVGKA